MEFFSSFHYVFSGFFLLQIDCIIYVMATIIFLDFSETLFQMTMNRNDELYLEMTSDKAIFEIEINNTGGNNEQKLVDNLCTVFLFFVIKYPASVFPHTLLKSNISMCMYSINVSYSIRHLKFSHAFDKIAS